MDNRENTQNDGNSTPSFDYGKALLTQQGGWTVGEVERAKQGFYSGQANHESAMPDPDPRFRRNGDTQ